jgi:hypothetical protein
LHIIERVAGYYYLDPQDLIRHDRSKALVRPRHVCAYVMRHRFGMSYPQIAEAMRRDHSSIIHAVQSIARRLPDDPWLTDTVKHLMAVPCTPVRPAWLPRIDGWKRKAWASTIAREAVREERKGKPRNDFDTGAPVQDAAAVERSKVRAGSDRLLQALQGAMAA